MKKFILSFTLAFMTMATFATELNYQWKTGASYHFTATVNDDISTSMMGMEMKEKFKTTTDFVLYINNVQANGTANGILYLINYKIEDSKGTVYASLKDLPQKALKSDVSVDKKGNFTFVKKLYLITSGSTNVLAYGNADENSVSVGGQAGNMKVDAYAEFDPKTGALKTGYSVKEIKSTSTVEVKVTEETDMIDVLPYDFLSLLALPEGNINLNDEVSVNAGMYQIVVHVNSMSNGVASLHQTMTTDKSKDMFDAGASGKSGDGTQSFDMNMDTNLEDNDSSNDGDFGMGMDMDMGGMDMNMDMSGMDMMGGGMTGMSSEDQAAMSASKSMSPDMTGDVTSKFDYSNGMFESVGGTITTEMNAMGVKIKSVSTLQLVLNK